MDKEALHRLRNRISIPLSEALPLIKKHKGDVAACELAFHQKNLLEICSSTGCEEELARTYYQLCGFDIAKAIERINNKEVIFTMRETPIPRNAIGFILWPEKENSERYDSVKREDVFIPREDFDLIIEECKEACNEDFTIYGANYYDKKASKTLLELIQHIKVQEEKQERFLQELITWFQEKMKYAEIIVIEGNL